MTNFSSSSFASRHLGINNDELQSMLETIGATDLNQLIDQVVPDQIQLRRDMSLPSAMSEYEYLTFLKSVAAKNKMYKNYLGQGYYGTITPSVILRNIFENPGWYTQYTPYQAEIAQGRLEALLNYQTMVSDLTAMPLANASLLDEGTAAAEAMSMFYAIKNKRAKDKPAIKFFVDNQVFDQTVAIVETRAYPLGIEIVRGDWETIEITEEFFGVLLQYPNKVGAIEDYSLFTNVCAQHEVYVAVAADLMSLCLLTPPGEWGADVVLGSTQRFGVPMGFGGPHAAYFATKDDFKRQIPGRVIGVSVDRLGNPALRMALQTREQHIKREKATSNICTAQALLAIMAGMYAVYHGKEGLVEIASEIHNKAIQCYNGIKSLGCDVVSADFFDTITIDILLDEAIKIKDFAATYQINLYAHEEGLTISIDETTTLTDIEFLIDVIAKANNASKEDLGTNGVMHIPSRLVRSSSFLDHPVFSEHRTETKMMRYIKSLENKDLSLVHAMIPLGSCTMKLNAATELIPVTWPEFGTLHPFTPLDQCQGYLQMFTELERDLCEITGFTACSLQPNSGAQGEYAGLMTIRAYHENNGDFDRNVAIIPSSAHGTNPASAVMLGMKVVIVACDERGNIDVSDLKTKVEANSKHLAALMVTYPSTHGVFETAIMEICQMIHDHGGLVYMDGANMNAQVGLTSPGLIGADVCHLNLHKTFAIPHGGGGPGMGPICCNDKLKPFLPGHLHKKDEQRSVSSAPWGSASILLISYAYIKMLGGEGLKNASKYAILNANYIKARLEKEYSVLYTGEKGRAAHELIIDLRMFKSIEIGAEDIAKRLIDYGFHAPTMSFPVPGTIMIEPTESEDKKEIDRFCDSMLQIKNEINAIANGQVSMTDNVLTNAPHTLLEVCADQWNKQYSRQEAAYPLEALKHSQKFWPAVARVDNAYGDRNLVCTCPPIESYVEQD